MLMLKACFQSFNNRCHFYANDFVNHILKVTVVHVLLFLSSTIRIVLHNIFCVRLMLAVWYVTMIVADLHFIGLNAVIIFCYTFSCACNLNSLLNVT